MAWALLRLKSFRFSSPLLKTMMNPDLRKPGPIITASCCESRPFEYFHTTSPLALSMMKTVLVLRWLTSMLPCLKRASPIFQCLFGGSSCRELLW